MKRKRTLTKRELQLFRLIAAGKTNSDIASRLDLSVKTVETHKHNILIKLGADNVQELKRFKLGKE